MDHKIESVTPCLNKVTTTNEYHDKELQSHLFPVFFCDLQCLALKATILPKLAINK